MYKQNPHSRENIRGINNRNIYISNNQNNQNKQGMQEIDDANIYISGNQNKQGMQEINDANIYYGNVNTAANKQQRIEKIDNELLLFNDIQSKIQPMLTEYVSKPGEKTDAEILKFNRIKLLFDLIKKQRKKLKKEKDELVKNNFVQMTSALDLTMFNDLIN